MRSTAPNTHCAHRWANNEDPQKSGKSGHMRFDGMEIYSYATVIAVKYPKKRVAIMAGDGIWNSSTTVKHKSRVRSALPGCWDVVAVDCDRNGYDLRDIKGVRRCHDGMKKTLAKKLEAVAASRRGASLSCRYREYAWYLGKCNAVAAFLGRRAEEVRGVDETSLAEIREEVLKRQRRDAADAAKKQKQLEKARAERYAETLVNMEKWRNREPAGDTWNFPHIILRISKCGKFVETSAQAVVPFKDALLLFGMCRRCREKNEGMEPAERTAVGDYSLWSITNEGDATVGCHLLMFTEMQRCFNEASKLGLC